MSASPLKASSVESVPLRRDVVGPKIQAIKAALAVVLIVMLWGADVRAAGRLNDYLSKAQPADLVPNANRFGPLQGEPAIAPAYKDNQLLGYVYLNSDFANAVGYSGKPIQVLVGIDPKGVLIGLKLVEHKEPIVLVGIPEKRILEAVNKLIGADLGSVASGAAPAPQVDIVSGATVTVLVIGDSIVRSATKLIRGGRLGGQGSQVAAAAPRVAKAIDTGKSEVRDWQTLVGEGSVRRLILSVADVNQAFEKTGNAAAAARPEEGAPDDTFIDLYVADVSVPTIGRSLLGDDGYDRLAGRLKPGQQALVVAGSGRYSFKGAAYVRGGIFDRIELIQEANSVRFRDRDHTRLGSLAAEGAPDFSEIALFVVPVDFAFDPAEPWVLQLLVQRVIGAREKGWVTFDLAYTLPESYLKREPLPQAPQAASVPSAQTSAAKSSAAPARDSVAPSAAEEEPLWMKIWRGNVVNIGVTVVALGALTLIFFFQNFLVRRPAVYTWVRRGYLLFILVWMGWYANAQLSVVNVLTFANSLLTGFSWEYFLSAPLIFILWASIAAGLLFWGRGPFCGWLCPFGALQELLNNVAQALKVPQYRVPWGLHERLWPIKYIIFLGLFGMSLYSTAFAEQLAEVEPFKTSIILKFAREWPFVVYALTLLAAGLFVERFFCRYLCPLGAALAIPGRVRMFEWLRRWPECGSPCQRCANECPVQSIHPEGHINVNECIYCMHCQELYFDDHRCPHMIQVRLKREKRQALSSPSMRPGGKGPATVITAMGKPVGVGASPVDATPPAT
jgi:NosR/NirI family nitrous oxide reductase transcriptional regulator